MITIGLTGSIGMGKSTVAKMFAAAGARVWDADAAVHRLYAANAAGAMAIAEIAPDAIKDGAVDRLALRAAIIADPTLLKRVEAAIHPLVAKDRAAFLEQAEAEGAAIAICDIPLLFEGNGAAAFDATVTVSAPPEAQRARVLERPNMTEEAFEAILAKQLPDAEKRARATYVIDTGQTLEDTERQVTQLIEKLMENADA